MLALFNAIKYHGHNMYRKELIYEMTTYIINGDIVTVETYERDRNDNFNLGIAFTEETVDGVTTMEYED